jgi:hypothetical protein|tara:strand:+ start:206 stop:532 length:327 start_codon:yes stop_codon:yes gene_type:complete
MDEFEKVKDRVLRHLKDNPSTRNSDKVLYYSIMKEVYYDHIASNPTDEQKRNFNDLLWTLLNKTPNLESIRRIRQKIQADCVFMPTDPAVKKKRKMREDNFYDYFSSE